MAQFPAYPADPSVMEDVAAYLSQIAQVIAQARGWSSTLSDGIQSAILEFDQNAVPSSSQEYLVAVSLRLAAIEDASQAPGGTTIEDEEGFGKLEHSVQQLYEAVGSHLERGAADDVTVQLVGGVEGTLSDLGTIGKNAADATEPVLSFLKSPNAMKGGALLLGGYWLWRRVR